MNDSTQTQDQQLPEDVRVLDPDFALKKKIGENVSISTIFTPERIAEAQKSIDDTQAEFLKWTEKDISELEQAFRAFSASPDAAFFELDRIRKIAFSIKCQAGTFGFALASDVSHSLYTYATKHEKYAPEQMSVLQKHVEALVAIFSKNIQNDGGAIGTELKSSLEKLVSKFS